VRKDDVGGTGWVEKVVEKEGNYEIVRKGVRRQIDSKRWGKIFWGKKVEEGELRAVC
jgi:hypothetical protein